MTGLLVYQLPFIISVLRHTVRNHLTPPARTIAWQYHGSVFIDLRVFHDDVSLQTLNTTETIMNGGQGMIW